MKMKNVLSVSLAALMAMGIAVPALAADTTSVPEDFPTVDYVDEMLKNLDGQTDENGIPMVIAPGPAEPCSVKINGEDTDIKAVVAVPLRAVAEKLGFTVTWNKGGIVTVDSGEVHSEITIGKDLYYTVNNAEDVPSISSPVSLGLAPYVTNNTTYVPAALFDQLLGLEGAVSLENGSVVINTRPQSQGKPVAPASPYLPCSDLNEAAKLAGFPMTVPGTPDTVEAWEGVMIQAIYGEEDETMRIRKAAGEGDISGDYTNYDQVKTVNGVTIKGAGDVFSLAVWEKDGYAYSVSVAAGLSQADLLALAASVR